MAPASWCCPLPEYATEMTSAWAPSPLRMTDGYFMVVNAGNIDKNFQWLNNNIINDVAIDNKSSDISLIALQGPNTRKFLSKITG